MAKNQQEIFDFSFRASMGGKDFVISQSNKEAVLWLDKWKQWTAPFLIVTGVRKSGKTHLCHVWEEMVKAQRINLNEASRDADFLANINGAGFYFIDNIDRISKLSVQAEQFLFHLYNLLRECGGRCLLVSLTPPIEWDLTLEDAKSRLLSCPVTRINEPDEALLEALLTKQFRDRQILIKHEIISFLINRIERSFKAVDEIVEALDFASLKHKKPITLPFVREVLNSLYSRSLFENS